MRLSSVEFTDSADAESLKRFIARLDLKPPVLIKPNWGCSGFYTEAQILDWVLGAINGEKLVVESYGWARCKEFLDEGKLGSKNRGDLRKSDAWFLEYSGIDKVLEKHDVEFLNITEEVWAKRTADSSEVKDLVEKDHTPVQFEKMYGEIPQRFLDLKGGTLLSLAKLRLGSPPYAVSLSVKNLFGMIPGPGRYSPYHGKKNCNLPRSVLDINKVYRSIFHVKGIVDGVLTADSNMPNRACLQRNLGLLWAGTDTIELDALVSTQFGRDPFSIDYLRVPAEELGMWSDEIVELGKKHHLTGVLSEQ